MTDPHPLSGTQAPDILRGVTAGVVAGIVASFAMDRFQAIVTALSSGGDGDAEPATAKAADRIAESVSGAPIPKPQQALAGQIVHYAVGAGLGAAYGIAAEFQPQVSAGYGSAFALVTAALLDEAGVPAAGLGPAPWKVAPSTHLYTLASHLVFGAATELVRRQVRSTLLPAD